MGLKSLLFGSPEERRERQKLKERKRKAYQEGVLQGRQKRAELEIEESRQRGYRKASAPRKPFHQKLASAGKALSKDAEKMSKNFNSKSVFKIPDNDPFGFSPKQSKKKKKKNKPMTF